MDEPGFRDWAELQWDVLREIFDRVGTVCLFVSVQSVCWQWRRLAQEPRIWRRLHLKGNLFGDPQYPFPGCNMRNIGLAVIDRSAGWRSLLRRILIPQMCFLNMWQRGIEMLT